MQVLPVSLFSLICQKACKIPHFYEIWVISGNNNGSSDDHALSEGLHRGCVIYTEKQLNCHALSCWHHSNNFSFRAYPPCWQLIWNCLWNIKAKYYVVTIFILKKLTLAWKLLTGCPICDYLLKKRMMALKQMIDKKKHFCLFSRLCPVFTLDKFCPRQIFPFGTKFVKLRQTIWI